MLGAQPGGCGPYARPRPTAANSAFVKVLICCTGRSSRAHHRTAMVSSPSGSGEPEITRRVEYRRDVSGLVAVGIDEPVLGTPEDT